MAQWQRTLRLQPEWGRAQDGSVPVHELAGVIAARLKSLVPFKDERVEDARQDLIREFEQLSQDDDTDVEEFDHWMNELYDWGDQSLDGKWNGKKVCWIDTISQPANNGVAA